MPYPPSLEERGMNQAQYSLRRIIERLRQDEKKLSYSYQCFLTLNSEVNEKWQAHFAAELKRIGEQHKKLLNEEKVTLPKDNHSYSKSWPSMDDVNAMKQHNQKLNKLMQQMEVDLCILRTFLMQYYIPNAEFLSESLQQKLKKEKALHLAHRRDDIASVIVDLDQQIHREIQDYLTQQAVQPQRGLTHNYPPRATSP